MDNKFIDMSIKRNKSTGGLSKTSNIIQILKEDLLDEREKEIIYRRFVKVPSDNREAIAKDWNVSGTVIHRLQSSALKKIQSKLLSNMKK